MEKGVAGRQGGGHGEEECGRGRGLILLVTPNDSCGLNPWVSACF
jgi:hypothetical protein